MKQKCPDCGRPMDEHLEVSLQIDLIEVIARWLHGYGEIPFPGDTGMDELVEALRQRVQDGTEAERRRLFAAAMEVTTYVGEQVVAQYGLREVHGHA